MLGGRCATSHEAGIDITSPRLKSAGGWQAVLAVAEEPKDDTPFGRGGTLLRLALDAGSLGSASDGSWLEASQALAERS